MTMCAMLYSMTTNTTRKTTLPKVPEFIAARVSFDCNGTLMAAHQRFMPYTGRLPQEHVDALSRAVQFADCYIVWSYATPIAWFANGEWTMPEVKYSPTTSRHQAQVQRGINA